jgi:RNA polymerase sigma-70 factor (ECF subfamily)
VQDGWTDEALWRGLVARDTSALEALIARYAREVAYFVRVVLDGVGTAQDAEECASDVFIAAWEDADSYDPARGAFRTWLTMRAKYVALDRRRQMQRRPALAWTAGHSADGRGEWAERGPRGAEVEEMALADDLQGLLERRERQAELRRALEQLPELDRLVVYLRYFRWASAEEIAAKTGLTRRAVDTRLWRARKSLREALQAIEERTNGRVPAF